MVKSNVAVIEGFEAKQAELRQKVMNIWAAHGMDDKVTTEDILLAHFSKKITKDAEPTRTVEQVILQQVKGDPFLTYQVLYEGNDRLGNPIYATDYVGFREIPIINEHYKINQEGDREAANPILKKVHKEFFIPFSTEVLDALKPFFGENVSFIVKTSGSIRYGGYTFDEFRNIAYNTLLHIGEHGRLEDLQYKAQIAQQIQAKTLAGEKKK
jgi:hypothetical protein